MTMLEKIIKGALKSGLGIAAALALTSAKAQYVYLEASTEGIEWRPGQTYQLTIYADNTSLEGQRTSTFFWSLAVPDGVTLVEAVKPNPHYVDDFFSGFAMNNNINVVSKNGSDRTTLPTYDPIRDKVSIDGPSNRRGVLGVYEFRVDDDAKEGQKNFVLYGTRAYSAGEEGDTPQQKVVAQQKNVGVIKDSTVVICNYNVLDNTTDVTVAVPSIDKYKLEASEDLKNWKTLFESAYGGSFTYHDGNAPEKKHRFYRAAEVRE